MTSRITLTILAVCLLVAPVISDCIEGELGYVNVGLQNGILPTNLGSTIFSHQTQGQSLSIASTQTISDWTVTSGQFQFVAGNPTITVTPSTPSTTLPTTASDDGVILVQQSINFNVQLTFTSGTYQVMGVAKISNCPFSYSFNLTNQAAPQFFALTAQSDSVVFNVLNCQVSSFEGNFPVSSTENNNIVTQLNTNAAIQTALAAFYVNVPTQVAEQVTTVPAALPVFQVTFPRVQSPVSIIGGNPVLSHFETNFTGVVPVVAAVYQVTLTPLTTPPVCVTPGTIKPSPSQQNSVALYTTSIFQNIFNQLLASGSLDTILNQFVWPVSYLPWFTGGWASLDTTFYNSNSLNTAIAGTCSAVTTYPGAFAVYGNTTNNQLQVSLQYNCVLNAGTQTAAITITMPKVLVGVKFVQGEATTHSLQLFIQDVISPQVSTTLTGSAAANYYVVAAIKSLFVGTEITNPIAIQIPAAAASLFSYQFSEEGLIVYGP